MTHTLSLIIRNLVSPWWCRGWGEPGFPGGSTRGTRSSTQAVCGRRSSRATSKSGPRVISVTEEAGRCDAATCRGSVQMRSNAYSSKVDFRQRLATPVFRWIGPLVRLLLRRGLGEPNVLLTVRGRRTGKPRTTPVAIFELGDGRFVEAAFGEVDWVRNLRASGVAVLRRGRWSQT